jgi:peptide deformylase
MRPKQVRIRYLDKTGCSQIIEVEDLLAVCLQHEMDHLKGILFVDHISKLKRDLIMRKLRKMKKLEKKGK